MEEVILCSANRHLNKETLIVLVYNFLDLLAHHRSRDQILQETIPTKKA
jgi:hypothetical protein